MEVEWDPGKSESNLAKHGVSFDEAKTIFTDPLFLVFADPDHSVGENRLVIMGESSQGRLLVVAYAERGDEVLRLISARPATRKERRAYEEDI